MVWFNHETFVFLRFCLFSLLSELDSYLESGLENAVGHAVSVAMTITVFGVVVFIGKEHQVDLNKKLNSKSLKILKVRDSHRTGLVLFDLWAGVALPLLRSEGADGVLGGGGVARQYLNISVAAGLYLYPPRVQYWFVSMVIHHYVDSSSWKLRVKRPLGRVTRHSFFRLMWRLSYWPVAGVYP